VKRYLRLLVRGFAVSVILAGISLIGELIFVVAMRFSGHDVVFTSFYAVGLFAAIMGFIPFQPAPCPVIPAPVSLIGRFLLLIEISLFVATAISASSAFIEVTHASLAIDIQFATFAYLLVLLLSLATNSRRLIQEISSPEIR
jgi:hypothetical protein